MLRADEAENGVALYWRLGRHRPPLTREGAGPGQAIICFQCFQYGVDIVFDFEFFASHHDTPCHVV